MDTDTSPEPIIGANDNKNIVTMEEVVHILKTTLPDSMKSANRSETKPKPSPAGAQASVWMFVNRDLSQCVQLNSYDEVYPNIILGDQ